MKAIHMGQNIAEIDEELDHLRNRVDAIDERVQSEKKPWYQTPSNIVAILAFVVSLGTTVVSYLHTQQQDVHSLRAELRGIMQRLAALPKENVESISKYKNEPGPLSMIASSINQENSILAQQANDILQRLPVNQTSSVDYMTVGQSLMFSRKFDAAIIDINKAIALASGLDESVGALRILAALQMAKGNTGEARAYFQRASDIFSQYPAFDDFTQRATSVQTELLWAGAEVGVREFGNAEQHAARAQDQANGMQPGPGADMWRMQVMTFKQQLQQIQKNPTVTNILSEHPMSSGVTPAGVGTTLQ